MLRRLAITTVLAFSVTACAQDLSYTARALKDGGATRLDQEEVRQLIRPGTGTSTYDTWAKNWSSWTNRVDGTLTSTIRFADVSYVFGNFGEGKWRLTEDGLYCVNIAWKGAKENWCKAIYRMQGALYLAPYELNADDPHPWGQLKIN